MDPRNFDEIARGNPNWLDKALFTLVTIFVRKVVNPVNPVS